MILMNTRNVVSLSVITMFYQLLVPVSVDFSYSIVQRLKKNRLMLLLVQTSSSFSVKLKPYFNLSEETLSSLTIENVDSVEE